MFVEEAYLGKNGHGDRCVLVEDSGGRVTVFLYRKKELSRGPNLRRKQRLGEP